MDGGPGDSDEEEKKGAAGERNGKLGFISDDEENDEDDMDEDFDLNVTMDMLQAPFKKADEFAIFNQQLRTLHSRDATYTNNLIAQLNESEKAFLKQLVETKRIEIVGKGGVKTEVARRIITVKRRGGGPGGNPGAGAASQQQ